MPSTPPCPHCGPLYAAALEAVSHLMDDRASAALDRLASAVAGYERATLSATAGVAMGDCGNAECNWRGPISECSYIGTVGPCCPQCREIVEPDAPGVNAGAPFAKGSWQHAVDDELVNYGRTSQEFATPHEAVQWLVTQTIEVARDVGAGASPAWCPIHQHHKWCEHNGGVMGPNGWTVPTGVKVPAPDGHVMSPPTYEEAVAEDRRAVLQLLYEAHHREPCGPTLEAISAAIQHLQAVDSDGVPAVGANTVPHHTPMVGKDEQ